MHVALRRGCAFGFGMFPVLPLLGPRRGHGSRGGCKPPFWPNRFSPILCSFFFPFFFLPPPPLLLISWLGKRGGMREESSPALALRGPEGHTNGEHGTQSSSMRHVSAGSHLVGLAPSFVRRWAAQFHGVHAHVSFSAHASPGWHGHGSQATLPRGSRPEGRARARPPPPPSSNFGSSRFSYQEMEYKNTTKKISTIRT
ncbi:hypothetical protein IWX90DRAFT_249847 [Phyllosticta citrichinensis]|uniref:Uncharacterized protein n=1 Tax=Phyllosticta citrichinensis TaxID=1130410 RepID=A0ABR1XRB5_9PEZI